MQQYVVRRLLLAIPTLLGVTVLIFVVMRILPGDPIQAILGAEGTRYVLSQEELEAARHSLGLDRPLYIQYLDWMGDVLRGDLGTSFWRQDQPHRRIIMRRAPITIQIAITAVLLAWMIGLPVGIVSAMRRNSLVDYITRFFVTLFMAIPNFWFALTLILITVLFLSWRPPLTVAYLWDDPVRNLQMTLGPAVVFAAGFGAVIARMTRATLLEVLGEDYIRTARAKGLQQSAVVWRHALRNALLPVVTISGLELASVMGGAVVVERAFSVPGLGFTLVQAVAVRDWWLIQNLVLLFGVVYVFVNLAVDLTYAWIDPRIRYQ